MWLDPISEMHGKEALVAHIGRFLSEKGRPAEVPDIGLRSVAESSSTTG